MAISTTKIKLYWNKHGTMYLLHKALAFLFSYVPLNTYCISTLPKNKIQSKCPLDIRKGSIDDFQQVSDLLENDDLDQIKLLFEKDCESFLAFSGNSLVHIATLRKTGEDDVLICYCETKSNFRGMNIYPAVLQFLVNYSFSHGKRTCSIDSSPWNKASIRGIQKAGFSFVNKKQRFKIFGKVFTIL